MAKLSRKIPFTITNATAAEAVQIKNILDRLQAERYTLIQIACAAYLTIIMFIPILVWQVSGFLYLLISLGNNDLN